MQRSFRALALPLALVVALVAVAPPLTAPARAATGPGDGIGSDLGVYAAMGCGLGLRFVRRVPGFGMVALGAVLTVCAIMIVDAAFTPDSP